MGDNKLIAGCLIGIILFLVIGAFIIIPAITGTDDNSSTNSSESSAFNNSTPEATAIFIAKLNEGNDGFMYFIKSNASLTSDGKYWIVSMYNENYPDEGWVVTVDAKTLMSKKNGSLGYLGTERPNLKNTWRLWDELKAQYIAEIQCAGTVGKPSKITMDGKEIWKVPITIIINKFTDTDEIYSHKTLINYVYVDVATGKSRNTWNEFNKASGTKGWLTLKEVDDTLTKMYDSNETPFKNVLRDSYPE